MILLKWDEANFPVFYNEESMTVVRFRIVICWIVEGACIVELILWVEIAENRSRSQLKMENLFFIKIQKYGQNTPMS
jgi:hypothetical protein